MLGMMEVGKLQEFRIILDYLVSSRPAWATSDLASKTPKRKGVGGEGMEGEARGKKKVKEENRNLLFLSLTGRKCLEEI